MKPITVQMELAGRSFKLETGYLAKQAHGSVVAYYGDTVAFAAVCTADPRPGLDFFPLSVEYREKTQAAGKFPGGFIKREGRPTTKEILTCRLIDRPMRPMFPDEYKDEVQVTAFVVQYDGENDPDIPAMNASFMAAHLADMPFQGPIAAVRVGSIRGKLVLMPNAQELAESEFDIIIAGSKSAVTMVEGVCGGISEARFLEALEYGHNAVGEICDMMDELAKKADRVRSDWKPPVKVKDPACDPMEKTYASKIEAALQIAGKHERADALKKLQEEALAAYVPATDEKADARKKELKAHFHSIEMSVTRKLLMRGIRIDGRKMDEVRPIEIKPGWMSRLHGSAIFTRGETQALVVCTLGTLKDQQIVDGLGNEYSKKFDLQYNFPPFSVGECRPSRGVSRREIGHGNLAERALMAVLPEPHEFPYTIRIISDILESNGSSSMATVCGGTLAMMDAGIPIKQPVAGVAMGLLKEGTDFCIMTDIMGAEDHFGDMDFKVAGTGVGITAVQMDIKVMGISREIMAKALEQARKARHEILKVMLKALAMPKAQLSKYAPRLLITKIPVDKIGLVIGPGGKNIKKLQEDSGATIEIEDDGTVHISSTVAGAAEAAKSHIDMMVAEIEVGRIYNGRVVSIKDFGAFVEILPGQEGLCHVSELSDKYVGKVTEVVKIGDWIDVKVIARDEQDRIKLSRKAVLIEAAQKK